MHPDEWTTKTDAELLEGARAHDDVAYSELWLRHHRAGYTAARSIAPHLEPEDLVSEAYLKILHLLKAGRGPQGAFRPYLYRVIRTLAADWSQKPESPSDTLDLVADTTSAAPWEDQEFDKSAASQAFASLNERWRTVLWYKEVEGLPPRQIATIMGISAHGVSELASRAREALRSGWVEAHLSENTTDNECKPTLKRIQRFQRGRLTRAASRDVEAHLTGCDSCKNAVKEVADLNRQLALVLAGLVVGVGSAATLLSGIESDLSTAVASTQTTPSTHDLIGSAPSASNAASALAGVKAVGLMTSVPALLSIGTVVVVATIVGASLLLQPVFQLFARAESSTSEPGEAPLLDPHPLSEESDDTETLKPDSTDQSEDSLSPTSPGTQASFDNWGGLEAGHTQFEAPIRIIDEVVPPQELFDVSLSPNYLCYFEGEGPGTYSIAGSASDPGLIKMRITQPPSQSPVELVVANGAISGTDESNWWFTESLTPLEKWPGLVEGDIHDAVIEVQLLTENGGKSPWSSIALPASPPPIDDCLP